MASVERTAYPRFRRLMSARELQVFYTPAAEEVAWARENASSDEHLLGLVIQLKAPASAHPAPADADQHVVLPSGAGDTFVTGTGVRPDG